MQIFREGNTLITMTLNSEQRAVKRKQRERKEAHQVVRRPGGKVLQEVGRKELNRLHREGRSTERL